MALIKLGVIVAGISGKVSGNIFSNNKGGNYVKTWTKPTNPNTPRQVAARAALTALASVFRMLTQLQLNSWSDSAAKRAVTNRLGEQKFLSGFQLYMKQNLALRVTGLAPLSVAPAATPIVPYRVTNIVFDLGVAQTVVFTIERTDKKDAFDVSNEYCVLSLAALHSASQKPKNFRQMLAINDATPGLDVLGNDFNFTTSVASVEAVVGTLVEGQLLTPAVMGLDSNDPWDTILQKYDPDTVHAGKIPPTP